MSSFLSTYIQNIAAIRAIVGSGDSRLLETMREKCASDMAFDDEELDFLIDEGAPTAYEALQAVVHGGPYGKHASQYLRAYQRLCVAHGVSLNCNDFAYLSGGWLNEVDNALKSMNVTAVSLFSFTDAQIPVPVEQSPVLGYGEWSADEIALALAQYEAAVASGLTARDPDVAHSVEQCVDWMRSAAKIPGYGIIGFFHLG